MFCPGCGLEEQELNQFCRVCGSDIRAVRLALESPDRVTASDVSARDEIGRAIAAKIRETKSTKELAKVAEEVLPQIEKFLESPYEKRLRRLRTGTIISTAGLGVVIAFTALGIILKLEGFLIVGGLALIPFIVGLGIVINEFLSSIPRKSLPEQQDAVESRHDFDMPARELLMPEPMPLFSSITENTTTHLTDKQPVGFEKD